MTVYLQDTLKIMLMFGGRMFWQDTMDNLQDKSDRITMLVVDSDYMTFFLFILCTSMQYHKYLLLILLTIY